MRERGAALSFLLPNKAAILSLQLSFSFLLSLTTLFCFNLLTSFLEWASVLASPWAPARNANNNLIHQFNDYYYFS